jgi:chromosome segregation ATPase
MCKLSDISRLSQYQSGHPNMHEPNLSSLEDALGDKEKVISQLRDQRDRAEAEKNEERELHERDVQEAKLKLHSLESEVDKLTARLERVGGEKVDFFFISVEENLCNYI